MHALWSRSLQTFSRDVVCSNNVSEARASIVVTSLLPVVAVELINTGALRNEDIHIGQNTLTSCLSSNLHMHLSA